MSSNPAPALDSSSSAVPTRQASLSSKSQPPPPLPPKDFAPSVDVDLILTFQAVPKKNLKSKTKATSIQRQETLSEYNTVLNRIKSLGLNVTTRLSNKFKEDGQILIFVKAKKETLRKARQAER